jgi:predicted ATPase/class 3 adenylate cyclase/Tfp pilus assembly protein PilF
MTELPSGTITFLFTDIQGSTPLWEREPEKMAAALHIHNTALRQAIQANGGAVFKIVGDAFQAAFPTAPQALEAAIQGQRALQSAPWNELGPLSVRMGLHTGKAELDPGGDEYAVSHTKNRAARIMSAAHGGQILLSAESGALCLQQLPPEASLKDLGEHRLKGMTTLEHLYQACAPGLTLEFPPLATAVAHPHNLPVQLTSFIGRERETAAVCRLLAEHRLVTLTGSGGTGKTRLSLKAAEQLLGSYPDGAWLVELAPLADPLLVPAIAATTLGVAETPGKSIADSLVDFLRQKRLLLILDNCEHLLEACAKLADRLLRASPDLTILASSRETLGVKGEAPFHVPPLSIPDTRHLPPLDQLSEYDAVRMFIERAGVVSPGFAINGDNATAVAQVVSRLDGIPLAIELAAARLRLLSVEQIALRLNDAFRLLTGGGRTVLPHHQTLRALVDWSHDMLSEPERAVLRRLSVFVGGWTLEAAETVCAGANVNEMDVLDLLSNLVEKSLVTCNCTGEIPRYFMLETLRQYAGEKLDSSAETEGYRQHHAEYFLKLAEEAEPQLTGTAQAKWYDRLETEHDNLRAAIEWAAGAAETEMAQRLCGALGRFWWVRGQMTEGRRWLQQVLAVREGVAIEVQAKALRWAGGLAWPQGDLHSAKIAFDESISLYRQLGDMAGMANVLGNLGTVAQNQGDYAGAWEMFSQSLEFLRELGNKWGMANALNNLGNVAQEQGDYEKAQTLHEESLAFRRELGDTRGMGIALNNLGSIALEQNNLELARAYFEQSLKINYKISARMMLAYNLSGMAQVLTGEGQEISAAQVQGATNKLLEEMGAPLEPYEQSLYEKTALALKQALGEGAYQQMFEAGKAMSLEQTVELALRKEVRASPANT